MFAVKDTRTGKFLRSFSGSFNNFLWRARWNIHKELGIRLHDVTSEQEHSYMWCLDTPDGAKLYKTEQGITTSFYSYRYSSGICSKPLAKALPWLQIVPVKVQISKEKV